MSGALRYIAIALLVMVSAYFSGTEIAFASANPARLKAKRQESNSLALRLACRIIDNHDSNLGAILIGNNLANMASSSIATLIVIDLFGSDDYVWVATLVMTVLVLIFGEIVPKVIAGEIYDEDDVGGADK